MDLNLVDPSQIPLPPEEVRLRQVEIQPYPDGRRLRLDLELTPFQQRPNIEVLVTDRDGREVASTTVVEAVTPTMELTLHLRARDVSGPYQMRLQVVYLEDEEERVVDEQRLTFEVPAPEGGEG